jgi:hypothetical protein
MTEQFCKKEKKMEEKTYVLTIQMTGSSDPNYDLLKADFERLVREINIRRGDAQLKTTSLVEQEE